MEIGARAAFAAFEAHQRSPLQQQKLSEVYKVAKPVWHPHFSVKQDPDSDCHGQIASAECAASRLCRAGAMLSSQFQPIAPPSLQRVKRELLSPSSCITNGVESSVVADGSEGPMVHMWKESLLGVHGFGRIAAHLSPAVGSSVVSSRDLFSSPSELPRIASSWQRPLSLNEAEHGITTTKVAKGSEGPMVRKWNESLSELQELGRGAVPLSPEVPSSIVPNGGLFSIPLGLPRRPESWQRPLSSNDADHGTITTKDSFKPVKLEEAVDHCEKSITAPLISSDTEAHVREQDLDMAKVADSAASLKLMTALHMIPDKQQEQQPIQVKTPAWKTGLIRVKSEPVAVYTELEPVALPKEIVVKKGELLDSSLETNHSGVFSQQGAPPWTSESEDDSEENGVSERLPTRGLDEDEQLGTMASGSQNEGKIQKEFKARNMNPGRRIQGGRVYDSAFGKTCHWCRQKTVEPHVKCKECTIHYCGPCLMNRNGEDIRAELCEGVRWLCPKCRGSCGPGCENCCNCGPCRKALGKDPTGILIGKARSAGFNNAHDYLVHLETGESLEVIARRKEGQDWTNGGRFTWKDTSGTSGSSGGASSSSEGSDGFTLNEETSSQLHQGTLDIKVLKKFLQKRKWSTMGDSLPVRRSQVEASRDIRRRTADSILASLKVSGQSLSKENVTAPKCASPRGAQEFKTVEKCIGNDSSLRDQDSETRTWACKREYMEFNDADSAALAVDKRKLGGDQRLADSYEDLFLRVSLPGPFSKVKCKAEPITTNADIPDCPWTSSLLESDVRRGPRAFNGVSSASSRTMSEQQRGMECPIDPQGADYRVKLKSVLARPFDEEELKALDYSVRCRKPVQKLRQMRGRIVDVVTEEEGQSYLDHHQDFAAKLEEAECPSEKLALLRGFFFWLQHSCMEGAFRPWPSLLAQPRPQTEDCFESEGPDCQVTAIVLPLDEGNEANLHIERPFMTMLDRPDTLFSIPYRARKKFALPEKPKMRAQRKVSLANPLRVVLGLPAPALSKS